ncbi:major facilitator superfamily transporter [Pleomassaria siparia CBS 279.74]|uniref:Lysosomal dipeptide transporter MFSD1 n=1 Tax=Pleomassaria siparia CBS 279.74 TaxID=1314801 RepID=A0A6G1JR36_9PLEO|nr:major facilitator superfamily transporter [Pleomassaria siparia CBS 279.74]
MAIVNDMEPEHPPLQNSSNEAIEKLGTGDAVASLTNGSETSIPTTKPPAPLTWKLAAVAITSLIRFGSAWSDGITSAMKSTLKKKLKINNRQFALLEASEDFMVTLLILPSGLLTDRMGGANTIVYGNLLFTLGLILVAAAAQAESFKFMIGARIIKALGDIATQVAQYKMFSSWFPPSSGFASTVAFELAMGKIGGFVGTATANVISHNTGKFSWTFWVAVFVNIFVNITTLFFWWFSKIAFKKFSPVADPSTGEKLTERSKKFELKKVSELPWTFWCVLAFSLFETSTAVIFQQNATEMAQQRFDINAIKAGWYSATVQYAGFFLVPLLGIFIDLFGNRISISKFSIVNPMDDSADISTVAFCGTGMFISMALINWVNTQTGFAAAFGVYAFALSFGPTTIIDSIRTSMWHQSVFGSAYAVKICMNNSMNIIVRIIAGVLQDYDDNSYRRVVQLYVFLAAMSVVVSALLVLLSWRSIDLRYLQWTRKQRLAKGQLWNERKKQFHEINGVRNRRASKACFAALITLVVGSWCAYIWGAVTGHNS